MTAKLTQAPLVVRPDRRRRHAGQIGAHDEFDRQQLAFAGHHHLRIGNADDVIGGDVRGRLEPIRRHLVQHLPLERDRAQHDVEGRQAVGDHDRPPAILDVAVANLSLVFRPQLREIRPVERLVELGQNQAVIEANVGIEHGILIRRARDR